MRRHDDQHAVSALPAGASSKTQGTCGTDRADNVKHTQHSTPPNSTTPPAEPATTHAASEEGSRPSSCKLSARGSLPAPPTASTCPSTPPSPPPPPPPPPRPPSLAAVAGVAADGVRFRPTPDREREAPDGAGSSGVEPDGAAAPRPRAACCCLGRRVRLVCDIEVRGAEEVLAAAERRRVSGAVEEVGWRRVLPVRERGAGMAAPASVNLAFSCRMRDFRRNSRRDAAAWRGEEGGVARASAGNVSDHVDGEPHHAPIVCVVYCPAHSLSKEKQHVHTPCTTHPRNREYTPRRLPTRFAFL